MIQIPVADEHHSSILEEEEEEISYSNDMSGDKEGGQPETPVAKQNENK